jgi:hypothetical protein
MGVPFADSYLPDVAPGLISPPYETFMPIYSSAVNTKVYIGLALSLAATLFI